MIDWSFFTGGLGAFAQTEFGRILATLLTVAVGALAWRIFRERNFAEVGGHENKELRRENFVLAKNLIFCLTLLAVVSIWATKIAGAALSLAAVAGAILIVSKDFLANILGSAVLAASRPYRVGDFIEMANVRGRVLDTDLLVTTIAETLEGHQLTGRTVSIPNSLLLTSPVRNLTATGTFVVNLLNVVVPSSENIPRLEKALLQAAREVCDPWTEAANAHLKSIESREFIDLPSAEPRVLLQLHDAQEYTLALRYTCRPNDRVKVEQDILRRYLCYREGPAMGASVAKMPLAAEA
ncbi:mechanosensitive ion channel family protein [Noviherbaspirillum massiliense]|uniref:mechanosensitive ion channel family protein n=1 Tax=Noviherbaspirillum massiliense TaxID=1465823 RepID=UPI00030AB50B|nr:mechanosensitive ion channel family protein [Noviherbaspirillum massiliense]